LTVDIVKYQKRWYVLIEVFWFYWFEEQKRGGIAVFQQNMVLKRAGSAVMAGAIMLAAFSDCRSIKSDDEFCNQLITVLPKRDDTPLVNPGKGWIVYCDGTWDFSKVEEKTWEFATLGYCRFSWSAIEVADGVYDWTKIDSALDQCRKAGKTFAFGIMTSNPTSTVDYHTPKFILDREDVNSLTLLVPNSAYPDDTVPGGYKLFTKHEVNYKDPGEGFFIKLKQFVRALRERYGNEPDIEYIDIRSFGSWGENTHAWLFGSDEEGYDQGICDQSRHDQGVDPDVMKKCWQIYIDEFKGTGIQLMTAWGYGCNYCTNFTLKEPFYWAAEQGVGVRRDGFSGKNGCVSAEVLWSVNKAPSALEMPGGYQGVRKNYNFSAEDLIESPEYNRASYYPIGAYGNDGNNMVKELGEAMKAITNRIGYYFVLRETTVSSSLGIGKPGVIRMDWYNYGVAKLFLKSRVELALLDEQNNVVDRCTLEGVDPSSFVSELDILTKDKANRISSTFTFNKAESGKDYKLAIGVFTERGYENPDISIGNERLPNNWVVLVDMTKEKEYKKKELLSGGGTKVTASSWQKGCVAKSALMQVNGYWTAKADDKQPWLLIDLGKTVPVSEVRLAFGNQIAKKIRIDVSKFKFMGFITVFETESNENSCLSCVFETTTARYIKISFLECMRQKISCAAFVPEVGENLIRNGDFSDGLEDWRAQSQDVVADTDVAGEKGGSVYLPKVGSDINQTLTSTFELTGPGTYRLTFLAYSEYFTTTLRALLKTKGSKDNQEGVEWWAPTKTSELIFDIKPGGWIEYACEITADYDGFVEMAALVFKLDVGDGVWIDSVKLEKISEISGERSERAIPNEGPVAVWDCEVY